MISVIIPAFNEQHALQSLRQSIGPVSDSEIIVVDGGSSDLSFDIAVTFAHKVLKCERGRGAQMNAGARVASGDVLLFLHADSVLPPDWYSLITEALENPSTAGGAFDLRLSGDRAAYLLIGRAASLRSRLTRTPLGDQGIFARKAVFADLGGYRAIPIMEDADFVRRLRAKGRLVFIPHPIKTSPRKWEQHGILRTTATHLLVLAGYYLGIPPHALQKLYRAALFKPQFKK